MAGATTFPPAGGLYSSLCVSFILPPLAGEVRRSRKGGGERSEPIRRMLVMLYDTESKSRNADFISIAREGNPPPFEPSEPFEPYEPSRRRRVQWRSRKGGGERSEPITRMLIMSYDTESKSRNVLASPLGEEGHEVAKGVQANWIHRGEKRPANPVRRHPAKSVWTVVILIMILDVDVTAAGVSKGEAALFLHDCLLLANTVISSGDACRYGADGKRFNDTLSREISRRNDARTIRGRRFLHSASLRSK